MINIVSHQEHAEENHKQIPVHIHLVSYNQSQITNIKDVEKLEPLYSTPGL